MNLGPKVTRLTMTEQIATSIEEAIIKEDLYREKLPSEQELCEQFGVSRTIIREALKLLSARGLVQSKIGGGSFVTKPTASNIASLLLRIIKMDKISDEEVYQMRLILEISAIKAAAERITEEELLVLSKEVDSMEENMYNLPVRMEKDIEFHVLLGQFSGNRLLSLMIESMVDVLRDFIKKGIQKSGGNEDGIHRHRLILEALRTHNPDIAGCAMRDHLEHSFANVMSQNESN